MIRSRAQFAVVGCYRNALITLFDTHLCNRWLAAVRTLLGTTMIFKATLSFALFFAASAVFAGNQVVLPTPEPKVSDEVLLSAIAEVETGNNSSVLGHCGERTRLQILPETWRRFSKLPHSVSASNRAETDRVARAYLASIRDRLKLRGLPETPFFIAAAWNAGPGWKTLSSKTVAYAERVTNIVEASQPHVTQPATPPPLIDLSSDRRMVVSVWNPNQIFRLSQ
jgi:hypothetical protein